MSRLHKKLKDEKGIALLISVILMLLISAIGIAALQHAREESSGSGRSRHHTKNLHAADGVLQLVVQQLASENPANRQLPVDFANFIQDPLSGFWTSAQTGTDETAPADPRCQPWAALARVMVTTKWILILALQEILNY